jgi:hypothetical protein
VEILLLLIVLLDRLKGLIMPRIGTPLKVPELNLMPEPESGVNLSDDMQQVLSLLTGFSKNRRIVLQSSPVGALRTTTARLIDILHFTGVGANDTQTGQDVPCSEVMCMAHADNSGKVWVTALKTATTTNAWPLAAGEVINISVDNLRDLNMLIVADGDKLITAYA